jgi:hypothetical protein
MTMNKEKKKHLESKGWKFGSAKDFLSLTDEEATYIDLKLRLSEGVRQRRQQAGLTQADFTAKLHSSQSREAKIEAGTRPCLSTD